MPLGCKSTQQDLLICVFYCLFVWVSIMVHTFLRCKNMTFFCIKDEIIVIIHQMAPDVTSQSHRVSFLFYFLL